MPAPKNLPATLIGYVTREQAARVREFAFRHGISMAEIVRRAVERYLGKGRP
jgi:hypothetical protein